MTHAERYARAAARRLSIAELIVTSISAAAACGPLDTTGEEYLDEQSTQKISEALGQSERKSAEVLILPAAEELDSSGEAPTALAAPAVSYSVVPIHGMTASTGCIYAGEAMPVRSHNATSGNARAFVPFQNVFAASAGVPYPSAYNWASNWSTWSTQRSVPVTAGFGTGGDFWSASSSYSGLEYASEIGAFTFLGFSFQCLLVGSTSWTNLQSGTWTNPLACQRYHQAPDGDDGPAIYYDDWGHNLMGASAGTYEHLYIWPNCNGPATDTCGNACGLCTFTDITDNAGNKLGGGHPTVRAHANGDVMVAFRNGGRIDLVFYTPNGTHLNDWVVHTGSALSAVTACQSPACAAGRNHGFVPKVGGCNSLDCDAPAGHTGSGGCMRVANKVQLATRPHAGRQYAYLTYTMTCGNTPDGATHTKAVLDVADVTDVMHPTLLRTWYSGSCTAQYDNAFEPYFMASEFWSNKYGWGFYSQVGGNPADTRFQIATTTDPAISSWTSNVFVDTTFTMIVDNATADNGGGIFDYGLGDYIGGGEDASGNPYFTYGRPVATTATTCPAPMNSPTTCMGQTYSIGLYAAKATF